MSLSLSVELMSLNTAKALGLTIPSSLLLRAHESDRLGVHETGGEPRSGADCWLAFARRRRSPRR